MPAISARPVPEKTIVRPNGLKSLRIRGLLLNRRQGNVTAAVVVPAKNLANLPIDGEEFFEIARKIEVGLTPAGPRGADNFLAGGPDFEQTRTTTIVLGRAGRDLRVRRRRVPR